ncbi:MAG TPA: heavy metal translocating P-type ATPase [Gemmatimonadaceae bacterium]|nr:heavy metal translocating P-type ATPase [Gemmatimonadaceae bacterium]
MTVGATTPRPVANLPTDASPATRVACVHCGLDVPGPLRRGDGPSFCCAGCEAAYAVINDAGLAAYYGFGVRRRSPVQASGRAFAEFDHPAFATLYVRERPDGLGDVELYLENVHCASCVWLVERASLTVPGVASAELDVGRSRVRIVWDRAATPLSQIAQFLDSLGYVPHPYRGARGEEARRVEDRDALIRLGVAGALAGNVMMIAFAMYAGWFGGMEAGFERYFRWWSLALATPALVGPGRVFFRSALGALRHRRLHMDVPIALALAAGYLQGAVNTVRGAGPVYFDSVATLIFLLLVGRFLQQRAQRAAVDASELLASLAPSVARVVEGDAVREVPVEALLPGWTIDVRAGDTIAADGEVLAGSSRVDTSLLTGESRPVAVAPGAAVFAGTVNIVAPLRVRVTTSGEESRIGAILRDVEEGARRRSPVVRLADRAAGWFIAAVLGLALVTLGIWLARDPARAMDNTIALLVVTCPCALALATPLAMTAAIGRAAGRGILIRGGDALEALAGHGTLILDKTGTVTEGRLAVVDWTGSDHVRRLVVALERHSRHPIAAAITRAWEAGPLPAATDVHETLGGGLTGCVAGNTVVAGSRAFVRRHLRDASVAMPDAADGCTGAWIAVNGAFAGVVSLADPVRAGAADAVEELRRRGWAVELLSGDTPLVAGRAARALGLPEAAARGGASPEAKRDRVRDALRAGPVVMVGDGVNDAAAMAVATVGIGVHGGAEACLATADIFTTRPGLAPVVELIRGARRTRWTVRAGFAVSIAYNIAGAALAMTGRVDPLLAAVLMPASSISVVLLAWRAPTFARTRA